VCRLNTLCVAVWYNVLQFGATYCSLVHHVAVCCSVLQCVVFSAVCCSAWQCDTARRTNMHHLRHVLQCIAMCCNVLQRFAACCSVMYCVAVCCGVLLCCSVAVCCSVLHCVMQCVPECSVLQCVACSMLQCVAICCGVLQ